MERLLAEGTTLEVAQILGLYAGLAFCMLIPITWIANKIVGLREGPLRRAQLTAGIPYGLASIIGLFMAGSWVDMVLVPLLLLPGAIVIFFWLRADYRRGWVDEEEAIARGIKLENDDWRVGVAIVGALAIAFAGKLLWKLFLQS